MFRKFGAEFSHNKRAGELNSIILMGISKSWNDLITSCNEKFITQKVSWPSWAELCGVLEWELRSVLLLELRDSLGFDPILGDVLILYIIVIILIQYPFQNQWFWGFGVYWSIDNLKVIIQNYLWEVVVKFFFMINVWFSWFSKSFCIIIWFLFFHFDCIVVFTLWLDDLFYYSNNFGIEFPEDIDTIIIFRVFTLLC